MPVVGAAIGLGAGIAGALCARVAPKRVAVACAFGAAIVLSGALHVDGFLDASDALFATADPQRRREIMRDPRVGSFAVAAFAIVIVVWLAALGAVAPRRLPAVLAFTGASARFAAVLAAFVLPYGGVSARGAFDRTPPMLHLGTSAAITLTCTIAAGPRAFGALAGVVLLALGGGRWCAGRLGGALTGDVYGFLIVALEPVALVSFSIA